MVGFSGGFRVTLEVEEGFLGDPAFRLGVNEGPGVESRGCGVMVAVTLRVFLRPTREDRGDLGWNISVRRA